MKTIELVIEVNKNPQLENELLKFGKIIYHLPMINSYVIEVPESLENKIRGLNFVSSVSRGSTIMAQMNKTREIVNCNDSKKKYTGKDITIAILDTGISPVDDFCMPRNRIVFFKDFINNKTEPYDDNAHGTHVAGIAAGNGTLSNTEYQGIAPECNIIALKILDDTGRGKSSDVLAGLQWVIDNKDKYNIRIVNLSIGTSDVGSKDPLVRAAEYAWDNGIVMVTAAGNNGPKSNTITSPGISKKVITVGASDDNRAVQIWGNTLVDFSGRGPTSECIKKPDVIAPGADIVSCKASSDFLSEERKKELNLVTSDYVQMSGTSMATPVISGAIALLLEKHPELTPDQIKYLIKKSTTDLNYYHNQQGWGLIDICKLLDQEVTYVKQNI